MAAVSENVLVSIAGETLLMGGTSSTSVDSSLMLGVRQVWRLRPRPLQVVCAVAKCATTQGDDVQWYLPPGRPGKAVVSMAGFARVKSPSDRSSMRVGSRQVRPASVSVAQ